MFPTEPLPFAALIACTALGANLLGTGLLILIRPGSRAVRWHAAFSFWIIAWLALQGWFTLGLGTPPLLRLYGWVVHLMATFFLAAALVETKQASNTVALAVVAAGAVTADVLNPLASEYGGIAWQALTWGSASVLHFMDRSSRSIGVRAGGEATLKMLLLVVVPLAVIGVVVLSGGFLLYAMPLITILVQFLIFVGVVHHRFYDLEVRVARSGDLAAQAAEQERLALLGELSASLAHEIRNPLTGMRSLTQRLAQPDVDEARRTRYAGVILDEIGRLDRIVGNLLDLSRRTAVRDLRPAATPLEPLFGDLVLLADGRARRAGVTLEQDAAGLGAAAPRDALAQSLLNLLINAIAHTPQGGRVRMEALRLEHQRIELRVTDTGPGVPEHERQRIFEPFQTQGLGVGLGLAVVRRLARELEWEVGVGDGPRGGACFYLRVPAASEAGHDPRGPTDMEDTPPSGRTAAPAAGSITARRRA